jgi:hypothetical protein
MVMRSVPHQAGQVDARVYVESDEGRWAEMLSVHAVELGAHFPDYSYIIGETPRASTRALVVGSLFLKTAQEVAKVEVSLRGTGLESLLAVRDVRVGRPIEAHGCVRRECSFAVELQSIAIVADEREVALPVAVTIDGESSVHHVRLTVLPHGRSLASRKR